MRKPEPTTQKPAYDWTEITHYIEEKYNIDIRNYATWRPGNKNPYQDFWHWFCDRYNFANESYVQVYFEEDLREANMEDWQKEIAKLYIKEFGNEFRAWIEW